MSASRKYEGTGLGLSLVKEVIRAHFGTVGVFSRHGGSGSGTDGDGGFGSWNGGGSEPANGLGAGEKGAANFMSVRGKAREGSGSTFYFSIPIVQKDFIHPPPRPGDDCDNLQVRLPVHLTPALCIESRSTKPCLVAA